MIEALRQFLQGQGGELRQEGDKILYTKVLAERRVLLGKRRVVYRARFRVDAQAREILYSEQLVETGLGMSPEAGVGTRVEVGSLTPGPREGRLAEELNLLGKRYSVQFDYGALRRGLEAVAAEQGYTLRFSLRGP